MLAAGLLRTRGPRILYVHSQHVPRMFELEDPTPSAEDVALTERLRQVGDLVGVRILDHVVVGRGRWVSMAESGNW